MPTFDNVYKRFGDVVVMEGFCDTYEEHKITCIMGPSGCGKTTLLNMIAGLIKEDAGILTKPHRASYVFQDECLVPQKTAWQNLELVLKNVYKDRAALKKTITRFLELVEMEGAAGLYPHEMSGGMRQRLALIRAFAYPSDVLLMDEPFQTLDIMLKDNIIKSFFELYDQEMRTTLFVTHDIDEALVVGDFVHVYSDKPLRLLYKADVQKTGADLREDDVLRIKNDIASYMRVQHMVVQHS